MQTHYKLSSGLQATVELIAPKLAAPPKPQATHHILVIDCSGSMGYELPLLREHIKNKLSRILGEDDTISIIWFSGRGQFGTLIEAQKAPGLRELQSVHQTIDRWLRPVGMTGFLEPVKELKNVIARIARKDTNPVSVYFLSDGCDNQWSRNEVIKAVGDTAGLANAFTVVEYGYYADRAFLAQMAATWGGRHVFSKSFEDYYPVIESEITKRVLVGPSTTVEVGAVVGDIAVAFTRGDVVAYAVTDGKVTVPEGVSEIAYLRKGAADSGQDPVALGHDGLFYALMSAFAPRVRSDLIWPLLKKTGDVRFIKQYTNCFGKQAYDDFRDATEKAAKDGNARLTEGYNLNLVPKEDAFTVLDLLHLLANSDGARIDIDHPDFEYTKIGRTRVDANTRLTADEQEELTKLTEQLKATKDVAELRSIQDRIKVLTDKPEPLVFKEDKKDPKDAGYDLDGLVTNEYRPNVSFRVKKFGTVDISSRLPAELKGKLPEKFPTFVYRNYTVIKDGLINVKKLPVIGLTPADLSDLGAAFTLGRIDPQAVTKVEGEHGTTHVFDLTKIPVINLGMVKTLSADRLFRDSWKLLKLQAELKVYKDAHKARYDKKSEGFEALYGKEAAKFLSDNGIVSYSGFNPKTLQTEATDVYQAKTLEVKIKGYSTLPSVNDVRKRLAEKKALNGPAQLMLVALNRVDEETKTEKTNPEMFKLWLEANIRLCTNDVRRLQHEQAKAVFTTIVGQTWFHEFKGLEDKSLTLKLDGLDLEFTAELAEVEEKI